MSPIRAARVRLGIRAVGESQLSELAERALHAGSVNEVHEIVKQFQQDWICAAGVQAGRIRLNVLTFSVACRDPLRRIR